MRKVLCLKCTMLIMSVYSAYTQGSVASAIVVVYSCIKFALQDRSRRLILHRRCSDLAALVAH
jgi:hypothetical protein